MIKARSIHPQRLVEPTEFYQERITQVGGLNRYGEPMFKIAWAQSYTVRQGGQWEAEGETFTGYKDVLLGDGHPHWMLLQWSDAGMSPSMPELLPEGPSRWYAANECPQTHLSLLGGYPYQGSYHIVLPLVAKFRIENELFIEAVPLSTEIIEMVVPIIKAAMTVSIHVKLQSMKDTKAKDEADKSTMFEDIYLDMRRNPNLASTPWLEELQRKIERSWNAAAVAKVARDRVFQSSSRLVI